MYYAKVTQRNPWGTSYEYYGFTTRCYRNTFVKRLNEQAEAHRNYTGCDAWPCMWTKYDSAEAITASQFHEAMPDASIRWVSDGDRWTFYMPATLFHEPEVITA